jgi:hypothetical protein
MDSSLLGKMAWAVTPRRAVVAKTSGFQTVDLLWRLLGKRAGVEQTGKNFGESLRCSSFSRGPSISLIVRVRFVAAAQQSE